MNNSDEKIEYDIRKRAQASTRAMIRALVAGYLLYLAWSIVKNARTGASSMEPVLAYAFAAVFVLSAAIFAVYTYRLWKKETASADTDETGEAAEDRDDERSA